MPIQNTTPQRLIIKLAFYHLMLITAIVVVFVFHSDALRYLPLGGTDALERPDFEISESAIIYSDGESPVSKLRTRSSRVTLEQVRFSLLFMAGTLGGTILIMLPITWTYSATRFDAGPEKNFVRALLILPICAATVVLLIQDSLALAFGLAALVAAVRFRVTLRETIDGIYVFAAICVGLAAGIGYLGIGTIMALIFCMTHAVLWQMDYGRNPLDDAKSEAKKAKAKIRPG